VSRNDVDHPLRPKTGNLAVFDFKGSWSTRNLRIPKCLECPTCSRPPSEIRLQYSPEICEKVETISQAELLRLLGTRAAPALIDVREDDEWTAGHLPGSRHWPLSLIEKDPAYEHLDLNPEKDIVLYCAAGVRSAKAARFLDQHRSLKCRSLYGGIRDWTGPIKHPSRA
jgi:rhodanese-related sulfurtransferase